jgi:DNA (cytosine-5)-methyltransferase 1
LIEDEPQGVAWHTVEETRYLLSLMSLINRKKVQQAKKTGLRMVGGIYKRTRKDEEGKRVQRAEVRFDDISGCLRTPVGGSSRQSIIIVEGKSVRSRLLSPREATRLMGLPDSYKLSQNYNEAYHLAGDGVVVPVVRFLAANILEPLLAAAKTHAKEAA